MLINVKKITYISALTHCGKVELSSCLSVMHLYFGAEDWRGGERGIDLLRAGREMRERMRSKLELRLVNKPLITM